MRPEIEPQSRTRTGIFAPTLPHNRPKTVDVRLVVRYFAQGARLQDCLGGKDFAIPSPVVEDGNDPIVFRRNSRERTSFGKVYRERLIYHDVFPSAQCGGGKREMAFIGSGDHHEIDIGMCRHFGRGADKDAGKLRLHDLSFGGPDHTQSKTTHGLDERRMESLSGVTVAN